MPVPILMSERVQAFDDGVSAPREAQNGEVADAIEHIVVIGSPLVALDDDTDVLIVLTQVIIIACQSARRLRLLHLQV